jgi:hypothetical protein
MLAEASGHRQRVDPHRAGTGGPAGNARLTAWTGMILLVFFLAELVTLLDLHDLINWHIAIGALLAPPSLLKTATTGWRIVRYYSGDPDYRRAGPPPMPLRMLGPLVIATSLAVLASGMILVALGPDDAHRHAFTVVDHRIDWVTVHQAMFVLWAVATGLHVLARFLPAVALTFTRQHPSARVEGRVLRSVTLTATAGVAAVSAVLVLSLAAGWPNGR